MLCLYSLFLQLVKKGYSRHTVDPFERLPVEIVLRIIELTADFVAIESLLKFSPWVNAVFEGNAPAVTESVLTKCSIMVHEMPQVFRAVGHIRSISCKYTSFAEFTEYMHVHSSLADLSTGALRELLEIAANIQRLACACLETLLSRFRAIEPKCWVIEHQRKIVGVKPYQPKDAGPPSWVEEYRVYHALWHLQLRSDLLQVANRLNWSPQDISKADHYVNLEIFKNDSHEEVIKYISDCIDDISTDKSILDHVGILVPKLPDASSLSSFHRVWAPPPLPKNDEINEVWRRSAAHVSPHNTMRFWEVLNHGHMVQFQVADITSFEPFRRLGICLWDKWRLYSAGLMSISERSRIITPDGECLDAGRYGPTIMEGKFRWSTLVKSGLEASEK